MEPLDDRDINPWDEDDNEWLEPPRTVTGEGQDDNMWFMPPQPFQNVTFRDGAVERARAIHEEARQRILQQMISDGQALFSTRHLNRRRNMPDQAVESKPKVTKKIHPNRDERLAKHAPKKDGERCTENVPVSSLIL